MCNTSERLIVIGRAVPLVIEVVEMPEEVATVAVEEAMPDDH